MPFSSVASGPSSYCSNSIPALRSSSTAASMSSTGKFRIVCAAGSWRVLRVNEHRVSVTALEGQQVAAQLDHLHTQRLTVELPRFRHIVDRKACIER